MANGMRGPGRLAWAVATAGIAWCAAPAAAWQGPVGATVGTASDLREGVSRASCVIMLGGRPPAGMRSGPANDMGTLAAAMTSTAIVDPAAKAALDLGPLEWPRVAQLEVTPVGDRALKVVATVAPSEKDGPRGEAAQAFLRGVIERTRGAVSLIVSPQRREVQARVDALTKRAAELRTQAEGLRGRLRAAESRGPGLGGSATSAASLAAGQRQQVEAQLARAKPRLEAIRTVLPKAEEQLGDLDAAMRELVAAREAVADALAGAVEQGRADRLELLRARADLADARTRLAEGGRGLIPSPLRRYRDEATGLEIEVRTLEAQLAALPPEPPKPAGDAPMEDPQRLRFELGRVENELSTTESNLQQARRELEALGDAPALVILDGREGGQ